MGFLACLEMCRIMEGILSAYLSTKCQHQGMASCSDHWRWPRWSVNLDLGWIAVVQCYLSSQIDIVSILDRFQNAFHVCYVSWSTWISNIIKLVWKPCRLSLAFKNDSGWQDASWLTWSWESQDAAKSFHLCLRKSTKKNDCIDQFEIPKTSSLTTLNWKALIWFENFCASRIRTDACGVLLKPSCGACRLAEAGDVDRPCHASAASATEVRNKSRMTSEPFLLTFWQFLISTHFFRMSQISESNEGTSRFGPWIRYNCFFILSVQYRADKQLRPWEWGLNRQQFACFNACRSSPAPPPQALGVPIVFLIIFGLCSLYKKLHMRPCAGHRNSDN